jgi:hypothetical protein
MPFALDELDILPLLSNVLNTVVYKDIPRVNKNITMAELNIINKLVKFIGISHQLMELIIQVLQEI